MSNELDQVHPQATIANISGARTSPMDEYDAIVTVCQDSIDDHVPEGVEYHFFNMADGAGASGQYGGRYDYDIFESAASTILEHLRSGDTILVHCHAGQSRSASTTIAALGAYENAYYHEIYNNIKSQRPQIHPDSLLRSHGQRFIEEQTGLSHEPFSDQNS